MSSGIRNPVLVHERDRLPMTRLPAEALRVRYASVLLLVGGLPIALGAWAVASPVMMSVATACISGGLLTRDIAGMRYGRVTPVTLFALGLLVTAIANTVGLLNANTTSRPLYFLYAVDEHLMTASILVLVGGTATYLGFRFVAAGNLASLESLLPRVGARVPPRWLIGGSLAAVALSYVMRFTGLLAPLGAIASALLFLPVLATFVLARYGARNGNRRMVLTALVIAIIESARGAAFAYLRSEIVGSLIAFLLGVILGARSFRPLRAPVILPVYAIIAAFVWYFNTLGAIRADVGRERFVMLEEFEEAAAQQELARPQTFLSRFTSFNQMSQVARLVEEDGFYGGATLEYLGYAFIPRILWPEKPVIAKGTWFALRIGQAWVRPDGRISNSVNMTIPGELYLNFGWLGVILGGGALGAYLALLWRTTRFWQDDGDPLRGGFGYYLLLVGLGLGADLQIVVTLMAMYVLFAGASAALRTVSSDRRQVVQAVPLSTT